MSLLFLLSPLCQFIWRTEGFPFCVAIEKCRSPLGTGRHWKTIMMCHCVCSVGKQWWITEMSLLLHSVLIMEPNKTSKAKKQEPVTDSKLSLGMIVYLLELGRCHPHTLHSFSSQQLTILKEKCSSYVGWAAQHNTYICRWRIEDFWEERSRSPDCFWSIFPKNPMKMKKIDLEDPLLHNLHLLLTTRNRYSFT